MKWLQVFKIHKEERLASGIALVVFSLLNFLIVSSYPPMFTRAGRLGFWTIFYKHFTVSGFDAYSYIFLSNGKIYFELSRHPLYAILLYPFRLLNSWLMTVTDTNCAVYIMAVLLVVCSLYSFVFLYRVLRHVVGINHADALLLNAFFASFSSIILTSMVPDHFCFSLFFLTLTLYIAGMKIRKNLPLSNITAAVLLFFTAGLSLNNGAKTCLSMLFVNGKRSLKVRSLLLAVILPLFLLGCLTYWQHVSLIKPQRIENKKIELARYAKDSALVKRNAVHDAWLRQTKGRTLSNRPFLRWTDVSVSRPRSVVENLFGEGIQLHQDHLLKDLSVSRPIFVSYRSGYQYAVEAFIVLLFVVGCVAGWRHRFFKMCLCWFACDMFLHVILGFGLNEVYIMGAHWMFIIPIAVAYLLLRADKTWRRGLRIAVLLLTFYLWIYNGWLIVSYMTGV